MSTTRVRTVVLCSLVTACALALVPGSAQAGTYKMYSCEPPGLNIAVPTFAPWRIYQINAPTTLDRTSCGKQRGGAMALGFQRSSSNYAIMPASSYAGFELPATELNPQVGIVRVKSWSRRTCATRATRPARCRRPMATTSTRRWSPRPAAWTSSPATGARRAPRRRPSTSWASSAATAPVAGRAS
jgi:hypothetical protein